MINTKFNIKKMKYNFLIINFIKWGFTQVKMVCMFIIH